MDKMFNKNLNKKYNFNLNIFITTSCMLQNYEHHIGIMLTFVMCHGFTFHTVSQKSVLTAFLLSSADTALWDRCLNISITLETGPRLLLLSDPARGRPCVWPLEVSTWLWWDADSEDGLLDGVDDMLSECWNETYQDFSWCYYLKQSTLYKKPWYDRSCECVTESHPDFHG
jgi:hypothetical protein